MTNSDAARSQIAYARLAGFMYLFVNATDILALAILSRFIVSGDAVATAHRIVQSELLYRVGLSCNLVAAVATVFLAAGLYVTVRPLNGNLALIAFALRVAEATLFGALLIVSFGALRLYTSAADLRAFDATQLAILGAIHAGASGAAFNIAAVFFCPASFIFFYLFLRSAYIPKFLSVLGVFASVVAPIACFAPLLWPRQAGMLQFAWIPMFLAETMTGFWLLIKGVDLPSAAGAAAQPARSSG